MYSLPTLNRQLSGLTGSISPEAVFGRPVYWCHISSFEPLERDCANRMWRMHWIPPRTLPLQSCNVKALSASADSAPRSDSRPRWL